MNGEVQELLNMIEKSKEAQKKYSDFSQKEVDLIFKEVALEINKYKIELAKDAVEETKMGIVEDKVIKNSFAAEFIYNKYKNSKTCGIVEDDLANGIMKIASPIGVLGAVIPTTNPTSTTIFKILLALKTRNGVILAPHPRAKKCSCKTAQIMKEVAEKHGLPKGLIQYIEIPSVEKTNVLMQNVDLILATGGPGMVKAAYSSGKPAIGVGAGNTPALIEKTANIKMAVSSILISKSFDNGVICASEQSVIVEKDIYDDVKKEFIERGAYILTKEETEKMKNTILIDGKLNGNIVGQSAYDIAKMSNIEVDINTKALIGEVKDINLEEAFAHEKLSPVLAMYKCNDYKDGLKKCNDLIELGGLGHTSSLYINEFTEKEKIDMFSNMMKTGRILINTPSSQGAIGDIYNFKLEPSLTLGCGSWGGNSVSENISVKHLLNIKTVAKRRNNMLWYKVPSRIYYNFGSTEIALNDLKKLEKKKALIVTDKTLVSLGMTDVLTNKLNELKIDYKIYSDVEEDPTIMTVRKGTKVLEDYKPDTIIAFGGGSPMDAAKVMWLLYEQPNIDFKDLSMRFMDIMKRIYELPEIGKKASLICIPTTSGTGSEVTPFTVITDEEGQKYPLADYQFTPTMAIIDSQFTLNMPKSLTAASGIDALTHALEAYVSVLATEFTDGQALEAIRLLFEYLPKAYKNGNKDQEAREKVAYASTIAGMAFGNAFLGICHSMAHKIGAKFSIPHGIANAILISEVVKFNATNNPRKQAVFSQNEFPKALDKYANIAKYIGIEGKNNEELVKKLILKIEELKKELEIPNTISEFGIKEEEFNSSIDKLAENAFDDQCTSANPRYPSIEELKEIIKKVYK